VSAPVERASDSERDATADQLRIAAGDGRLDHDELEERLEAAYAARTRGELDALTSDLPGEAPAEKEKRDPAWQDEAVRARLASFIVVNTICIVIWALTDPGGYFWPVWVLLGTGIALFSRLVHRALGVEKKHEELPDSAHPPAPPRLPGPPGR
jgi:hypothetical protein